MKYTVTGRPTAARSLSEIWLDSSDRLGVTDAADGIDSVLAICPHEQGEERSEGTRILILPPLAIVYEVSDDDRRVTVLSVKETLPRD